MADTGVHQLAEAGAISPEPLPRVWEAPPPPPEHPQGDEIRRQVEYYFSDENLPTDRPLLERCGGRENLPVSIRWICGFKRMRQYKPHLQVVEALKKSAFLDVVEDNKRIKRKAPFMGKTLLDEDGNESDEEVKSDKEQGNPTSQLKKAKQPQPRQQRQNEDKPEGFNKPHGFEEFFADAPVTPAEYKEEESMYDPGISFRLRMEVAIQRYKSRRKMHEHYANVFSKLMKYGGIESTQRQFTGGIKDPDLEGKDAADIALALATHTIDSDKDDSDKWPVDFEGVAKGFLSSYWPSVIFWDLNRIRLGASVLKNFYNYLVHHNVCPEHNDGIYAARKICDQALVEFPKVNEAAASLPGDFNIACSTLFDGFYKDKCVGIGDWDDTYGAGQHSKFASQPREKSLIVFKTAIGAYGSEEQFEALAKDFDGIACTGTTDDVGIEVTKIELPSPEVLELYSAQNAKMQGKLSVNPLGKLHCKHWDIPDFGTDDLPVWRLKEIKKEKAGRSYVFWIEADVLQHCFVGMKMQACVRTLSLGIQCLDQVHEVQCSFYTYLPNELMFNWKEPRFNDWGTEEHSKEETSSGGDGDGGED